jgi:hypothetical protein
MDAVESKKYLWEARRLRYWRYRRRGINLQVMVAQRRRFGFRDRERGEFREDFSGQASGSDSV